MFYYENRKKSTRATGLSISIIPKGTRSVYSTYLHLYELYLLHGSFLPPLPTEEAPNSLGFPLITEDALIYFFLFCKIFLWYNFIAFLVFQAYISLQLSLMQDCLTVVQLFLFPLSREQMYQFLFVYSLISLPSYPFLSLPET